MDAHTHADTHTQAHINRKTPVDAYILLTAHPDWSRSIAVHKLLTVCEEQSTYMGR